MDPLFISLEMERILFRQLPTGVYREMKKEKKKAMHVVSFKISTI